MKKFAFTLEKVLSYKKQMLEVLKNEMARLQMELKELEEKMAAISRDYGEQNRDMVARLQKGLPPRSIAVYKRYLTELDRRSKLLEAQRQEFLKAISAKQDEIVAMNSDISGLERLRDKQLAAYQAQCRKEQELLIEEFVSHGDVRRDKLQTAI